MRMRLLQKLSFHNIEADNEFPIPQIEKPFTSEDNILAWLHQVSPGFPVDPAKVKILFEPEEFYKVLLEKSQSARKQISLASLYIGSGHLEQNLVNALQENLARSNGRLSLTILLDYNRGSRGPISSRSILLPLVEQFKDQCLVALYHTPRLCEPLRSLLPGRVNEVVGLQHMKIYAFDDDVIISGANLSHDYFVNRQDRYVVLGDAPALARWAHSLVAAVARFSLRLAPGGSDALASDWPLHPFARDADPRAFSHAARRVVWHAAFRDTTPTGVGEDGLSTTWAFPLLQMAQLGIRHDSEATARLLAAAPVGGRLAISTGYFNPPPVYEDALRRCRADCSLLLAHPSANGFTGARGPAGALPAAYAALAAACARRLRKAPHITLSEFVRPGWTFHAKGMWLSLPGYDAPSLTLVGSPNYGFRSVRRDLELQLCLVTRDTRLRAALAAERDRLFAHARPAPAAAGVTKACPTAAPGTTVPDPGSGAASALSSSATPTPAPPGTPPPPPPPPAPPTPATPPWLRMVARLLRDFL